METNFPNLRHMRVFLEAAHCGSVSLAAKQCNLSQPAATQAISSLESRLGTTLLIRQRGKFSLTDYGNIFASRASAALAHINESAKRAQKGIVGGKHSQIDFEKSVTAAQLRNLVAISNHGSFTVAAASMGISQPTIHRAARNLEALAGTSLFIAKPFGVALTSAAESLVLGAKLAFSEIRQAIAEIDQKTGKETGTFILGSLPLARTMIVPNAIHAMISSTNGFQVRVVDGRYAELLRSLREGDIDCLIGALRFPEPAEDVEQEYLFTDTLAIVAHPSHPLANMRKLTLEDTIAYPWIAPPKQTPAGQYLFETLKISDREKTPVRAVLSSLVTLRGILSQGDYVSIVSRHQIKIEEQQGAIKVLDILLEGDYRKIGLTTRKSWRPTETQEKFIGYLRSFAQQV